MTDITPLFKACIKTVRLKNKSKIPVDHNHILRQSTPRDDLTKRALLIRTHLSKLHDFLLEHKSGYTRYANYLKDAVHMSDEERNIIDRESDKILDACRSQISELRAELSGRKLPPQCQDHYDGILELLNLQTKQVSGLYHQLKEYRVQHELETMQLLKLAAKQSPPHMAGKTDGFKVSLRNSNGLTSSLDEELESDEVVEPKAAVPHYKNKYYKGGNTMSVQDQDDENVVEDVGEVVGLSADDIQLLEAENTQLYYELAGLSDEVELINRNVVDIARLQDFFTEKVSLQQLWIDRISNTVVNATENVKTANDQIEQAIQRNAGLRVWALFFLIVMSFSLLFLDWYND